MSFVENPLSLAISPAEFQKWFEEENEWRGATKKERQRYRWRTEAGDEEEDESIPAYSASNDARSTVSVGRRERTIRHLTVEDLRGKPMPWLADFFNLGEASTSYSFPGGWKEGVERVERNLLKFLGNYIRLMGILFLAIMYTHPVAFFALLMGILLCDELRKMVMSSSREERVKYTFLLKRWSIQTAVWVLFFYFRVFVVASKAFLFSGAVVLLHAAIRHPKTRQNGQ